MKRLILVVTLLLVLCLASSAQAATKVHGGFATDSTGCAKCHITHAAEAANLLLSGNNQTEFCWACHGIASASSPYDVKFGAILNGTGVKFQYASPMTDWTNAGTINPSYTGGFVHTFDFQNETDQAYSAINIEDKVVDAVYGKFLDTTSAHNVQTITVGQGSAWNSANKIPGGSSAVSGSTFVCSSCHDPHGYNSTTAGGGGAADNPRLLRHDLPATSNIDVSITVDITNDGSGNATEGTMRTTGYSNATINKWCGGCHNMLDVGDNAGTDKGADTRYRHAMGLVVPTPPGNVTMGAGIPLATGNKLICISCHRVHGTAITMTAVANSWTGQNYDNTVGANIAKSGHALLRLNNRDVCYKCHDAALNNTNVGAVRQAPTY